MEKSSAIFNYIVVPADIADAKYRSFFQGFSIPLMRDYASILQALMECPVDICEYHPNEDMYLASKMCGPSAMCNFLRMDLLTPESIDIYPGICVVWSSEGTSQEVAMLLDKCKSKPLHISAGAFGDISLSDFNKSVLRDALIQRALEIGLIQPKELLETPLTIRPSINSPFRMKGHKAFAASINVLRAYGFEMEEDGGFIGRKIEDYTIEIIKLANEIDKVRQNLRAPDYLVKNDAIVYCNAIYAFLYDWNSHFWNEIRRSLSKVERQLLRDSVIKNKGYSNVEVPELTVEELKQLGRVDRLFGFLQFQRAMENRTFAQILAILAAGEFCPAIRLPNGAMHFHGQLKEIVKLSTSDSPDKYQKLSRKLVDYNAALMKAIGTELIDACFLNRRRILAICDFPIEWISPNHVPLMFTHEVSRITPTPGDLFLQSAVEHIKYSVAFTSFKNILVIRSFSASDPVGFALKECLKIYGREILCNLEISIQDVSSLDEVSEALNNFEGSIVIFDCHGGHDGVLGNGWLLIGGEKVDMWQLANRCRIPPIVILSACSTHAPDGSHASVANGFFRCGAQSVIGTFAPINTNHAAIFVCRLLHRVAEYVPIVCKHRPISWREIVGGFFKLSYVSDILYHLCFKLKLIDGEQLAKIQLAAHKIIETVPEGWEKHFFEEIINSTPIKQKQWRELQIKYYQFVDTMLYTHLGRPENISIYSAEENPVN